MAISQRIDMVERSKGWHTLSDTICLMIFTTIVSFLAACAGTDVGTSATRLGGKESIRKDDCSAFCREISPDGVCIKYGTTMSEVCREMPPD